MFDTTLRENLLLARRDASEAELRGRARPRAAGDGSDLAGAREEAGPGGHRFSGGERRRIALARAELAALPAADPRRARASTSTRRPPTRSSPTRSTSERGTLLITHRLTGLETMDEIVVLDAGRVVERGTHAELLTGGGRYAGLIPGCVDAGVRAR